VSGPAGSVTPAAVSTDVSAVVVNHDAGDTLLECVASLRKEGVSEVVVVDNASTDGSPERLHAADPRVHLVRTGANLGYGAGANRGIAVSTGDLVVVSNPDVAVHPGALDVLGDALRAEATLAIVGPCIVESDGTRYPSARRFPSLVDAAGHALLAGLVPQNRFTRRYRMGDALSHDTGRGVTEVDWVSGACFLARRKALEELGGFDESYFMYAEDADLCWRAHRAGWGVAYVPEAVVTHVQGVSAARRPYRMLLAHHRSVFRFARRTSSGWRRATLPVVAVFLAVRLVARVLGRVLTTKGRPALDAVRGAARPAE